MCTPWKIYHIDQGRQEVIRQLDMIEDSIKLGLDYYIVRLSMPS